MNNENYPAEVNYVNTLEQKGTLFLINGRWIKDGLWKEFFSNRILKSKIAYSNGELHGPYKEYYESGITKVKGQYHKGIKTGYWKEFYPDGTIMSEGNYSNGEKNGLWNEYHDNGYLKSTGNYLLGKEEGRWKYYSDFYSDYQYLTITYIDGRKNGSYSEQDDFDPITRNYRTHITGWYTNDLKDKSWVLAYNRNPDATYKYSEQGYYKEDKKIGEWITRDREGQILKTEVY